MRTSVISAVCVSIVLAWASSAAIAQTRGGGAQRTSPPATSPRGDQLQTHDRLKDQDRLHDQDKLQDQDRLHDQDKLQDRDRLKDQDKLHDQDQLQDRDRDRIHDQDGQPIYGYELMTPAEREAYMNRMRSLNTVQERNTYRMQHRHEMQERAREQGVSIPADNGQRTQQQGSDSGN